MLQQKVSNAAQTFLAKNALLRDQNKFLTKVNNEGKARRSTNSAILRKAKVMSYEDLEKARTERAAKVAKKAAKGPKNVASTALQVEEATIGKTKRGQKRKSATAGVDVLGPKAKVARINEREVAEGEQGASTPEPRAKVARMSETQVQEDKLMLGPWRAPVARMW